MLRIYIVLSVLFSGFAESATKPQRIASRFIGGDVILLELLKDQSKRIVALSTLAKDKRYSPVYDKIPSHIKPVGNELESLLKLKPDLVIAASYTRKEWLNQLEKVDTPRLILEDFKSLEDISSNIKKIAEAVGESKRGNDLVKQMYRRVQSIEQCKISKKKVLNYSPDQVFLGTGTIYDDLLSKKGISNLAKEIGINGWGKITAEKLATLRPDFVIAAGDSSDYDRKLNELRSNPMWKRMPAVKNGRLLLVPSRYLSAVSHHAVEFLELICR